MKRFGLIGYPIAHSKSPALFRAAYGGAYPYELIEEADFDTAYRRFLSDYEGINVTAPFKELAYDRADILSEEVRLIRAANLLVKTHEGIKAYNSDYLAVKKWLEETIGKFPSGYNPRVLIAGCGGAGKAAAIASGSLGLHTTLTNRSADKALGIIAHIQKAYSEGFTDISEELFEFQSITDFAGLFSGADIVIYTLPVPIEGLSALRKGCNGIPLTSHSVADSGNASDLQIYASENPKQHFLLEANYKNPSFTPELLADLPGTAYTTGTTWLLYQAITGYPILTGSGQIEISCF